MNSCRRTRKKCIALCVCIVVIITLTSYKRMTANRYKRNKILNCNSDAIEQSGTPGATFVSKPNHDYKYLAMRKSIFWSNSTLKCRRSDENTISYDYMLLESRNLWPYVQPNKVTTLIEPEDLCGNEPVLLLMAVHSSPFHFGHRHAIRTTWGRDLLMMRDDIRIFFILGRTYNEEINSQILEEATQYGDIVQEDFCDNCFNSTLKSIFSLKWSERNCPQAKHFVRNDDDTFVHPTNLINLLHHYSDKDRLRKFPDLGRRLDVPENYKYYFAGTLVSESIERYDMKSQWFVPEFIYPGKNYYEYLHGPFAMSGALLPVLYKESLQASFLHLENIFLTGIVARIRLKLTLGNHIEFGSNFVCALSDHVIVSGFSPILLTVMWNDTNEVGRTEFNACKIK